jgi:ADP-ribose pyrophosphatase YjhB (NUDIX family)
MNSDFQRFVMKIVRAFHVRWLKLRRPVTLGVKAAVYDEDGRVLLVRHSYVEGWHLPGGGVGRDERLSDAARREVNEELGLSLPGKLAVVGTYFAPHMGKSDHITLFHTREFEGEITPNWEIAEAAFYHPHELPEGITPATRRRLEEIAGTRAVDERW